MYKTGTLYKVNKGTNKNIGSSIGIRLIGAPVNIIIYGGECTEIADNDVVLSDLSDIANEDSPFIVANWLQFSTIPSYIAVIGTADGFEISNIDLFEIKTL